VEGGRRKRTKVEKIEISIQGRAEVIGIKAKDHI
jgi:hypothetical protein